MTKYLLQTPKIKLEEVPISEVKFVAYNIWKSLLVNQ